MGIACGFLITAIHHVGLVTLTHTPSPMNFLGKLIQKPENERAFMLFPSGFPGKNIFVPNLQRRKLEEVSVFYE